MHSRIKQIISMSERIRIGKNYLNINTDEIREILGQTITGI